MEKEDEQYTHLHIQVHIQNYIWSSFYYPRFCQYFRNEQYTHLHIQVHIQNFIEEYKYYNDDYYMMATEYHL